MIVVVGTPSYRPPASTGSGSAGGLAAAIARAAAGASAEVQLVGKIGDDPAGDAVVLSLGRDGIGRAALLRDPARPTPIVSTEPFDPAVDLDNPRGGDDAADAAWDGGNVPERILPEDPALRPTLEAGDLQLGLRYVADFSVLVLAEPLEPDARRAAFEAAAYGQAHVIVIGSAGAGAGADSTTAASEIDSAGACAPSPAAAADDPATSATTAFEAPVENPGGAFAVLVGRYAAALDAGRDPRAAFAEASRTGGWERAADDPPVEAQD